MELHTFAQLHAQLAERRDKQVLAVAGAADEHVLEPVIAARRQGLIEAILVGEKDKIRSGLSALGCGADQFEIVEPGVDETDAQAAVRIVRAGGANVLMKGMMETSDFLRPVVNRDHGLGTGGIMSHFGMHELKGYHKMITVTDAAMCTFPNLEKKKGILANVIAAYRALGYERPKAACLCCKETVDPKLVDTQDAAELHDMSARGEFGSAFVSGPISYDIAMSRELARLKKYPDLEYCEDFDILLVPNIHAGNILGKCLCITCHAAMGGIVMGAKVPIVLTSRGATPEEKLNSIALAGAVANN
ncbi:MAG: phosphate acyltransferase [Oscillospiraceae bacterium]